MDKAGELLELLDHLRVCAVAAGGENHAFARANGFARTHYDPSHARAVDRQPVYLLIGQYLDAAAVQHFEKMADQAQSLAAQVLAQALANEADLISGSDLGDWRERVATPDVPWFVTAEEQVAWGGINSFSGWDPDLVYLALTLKRLTQLECRGCASRRPASGSSPDAPAAAGSAPGAVDLRSQTSTL